MTKPIYTLRIEIDRKIFGKAGLRSNFGHLELANWQVYNAGVLGAGPTMHECVYH